MPDFPKREQVAFFRTLAASRAFQVGLAQNRNKMSPMMLLGVLQENAPLVFCHALHEFGGEALLLDSIKSGDHRSQYTIAAAVDKIIGTRDARLDYARNYALRSTGGNHGFDGNVHWGYLKYRILPFFSSDMFGTPGVVAGYAYGIRLNEWDESQEKYERPVGIAFFGDGAAQQGLFHETLNGVAARNCPRSEEAIERAKQFLDKPSLEAGVFGGVPIVFVLNDNEIACTVTPEDEHGNSNLAMRALGYGNTLGIDVDANNIFGMRVAALQAIGEAQNLRSVLVRARTFRGTAHNQQFTEYEKGALESGDLSAVKSLTGHDEAYVKLFKEHWEKDPFVLFGQSLVSNGIATEQELKEIRKAEEAEAKEIIEQALSEPPVVVTGTEKDRPLFPQFDWSGLPLEAPYNKNCATKHMGYQESFRHSIEKIMEKGALYGGQDVYFGGVLGLTRKLNEKFGPMQLINMSLSEEWILAFTLGIGLYGSTAICEFQFAHFIWDALRILRVVSPQYFQKQLEFDCLGILPFGPVQVNEKGEVGGSGEYHEADVSRYIQSLAGTIIFAPSNAYDMVGLMNSASKYRGLKMCLYQISAGKAKRGEFSRDVPLKDYYIPFGKAKIVHEGKDITVVTYAAACVSAALNEAEVLKKEGIGVEVIDLRTVYPCDFETILKSIKKTGRLIIMHEDFGIGGISAYITSELKVRYRTETKGIPIEHVVAKYPFAPSAPALASDRLPYERDAEHDFVHRSAELVAAVKELVKKEEKQRGVIVLKPSAEWRAVAEHLESGPGKDVTPFGTVECNLKQIIIKINAHKREHPQSKLNLWRVLASAAAHVLRDEQFSVLNGFWRKGEADGTDTVNLYPYVNLGIAYDENLPLKMNLEKEGIGGERLKILTLHDAHLLNAKRFSQEAHQLLARVQKGNVSLHDVTGYTFVFNNIGALGFVSGDSILPAGTSGMLNMGAVRENGDVNLQIFFDHRMCDGARAAAFVKAVIKKAHDICSKM